MKINRKAYLVLLIIVTLGIETLPTKAQLLNTVVALTGNVFNTITKEPVTAFVLAKDQNGKLVQATRSNSFNNGYYYLTGLKPGQKYTIILNKPKFFKEVTEVDIPNTDKYEEISKDFLITPLYVGVKIPVPVPPFELGKTDLRYGSDYLLSGITGSLKNNPEVNVEVECYPDNDKDAQFNENLTSGRCKSIINFFVNHGIDDSRLSMKANSHTDPDNPPPKQKRAKGKWYVGTSYIVVTTIK